MIFIIHGKKGPITEELVFRSCMCYILHIGGFGQTAIIWISSLSFGAAHLHHFIGHVLTAGKSFVAAFINVGKYFSCEAENLVC